MPITLHRSRLAAAAAGLLAALACAGASAQAASAQTLDGERLVSADHIEGFNFQGDCHPDAPSQFTFGTFGGATGPYETTFEEYGSFTLASPQGPVTAFDGAFTIHGDEDWIGGTHSVLETVSASCTQGQSGASFDVEVRVAYDVLDPFSEQGTGTVQMTGVYGFGDFTAVFGEQTTPPPAEPTTREDCLDGGWQRYPQFKNQGACVSYVMHSRRA